ncbi:MAG: hypothetical protein ACOC45_07445 [Alkalispirochaetaceae bacterium]
MPDNLIPSREAIIAFFSRHTLPLAAGGAGLLLLALLLVLLIALPGGGEEESAEQVEGETVRTLIPVEEAFLPNERELLLELEEYRYREPLTPWEEELVEQFWNPVEETAIEVLTEQAGDEIEELFEAVE